MIEKLIRDIQKPQKIIKRSKIAIFMPNYVNEIICKTLRNKL